MASQTSALPDGSTLTKPAYTDSADIAVINTNMDKIVSNINAENQALSKFQAQVLSGSSVDLDTFYGESYNGFYYITTGVSNAPVDYSGLIVVARGAASYQICIGANGNLYFRRRVGNPPAWNDWANLGGQSSGTVTQNASQIASGDFHIDTVKIRGTLYIVSGYIKVTTAIPNNTRIASVLPWPNTEVFASVVSSNGKTGRFKLTTNGELVCESAIEANSGYYSMTFVSNAV